MYLYYLAKTSSDFSISNGYKNKWHYKAAWFCESADVCLLCYLSRRLEATSRDYVDPWAWHWFRK